MVKSLENGTSLPPFLVKCYEMVSDESTNDLISWTESNDSFIIWDESRFSSQLLPKYFKHSNFSSFVRQLNIYGFRKIDTDRWQFANESFIKGQKHLLKNIIRRKQPQSVVQKKSTQPKEDPPPVPEEVKKIDLWNEVENLKNDKNALMQELKKLRQHQQNSQSKMRLLSEQMKGMEKNQQQMLSFIVMAMQSPEFMVQFFQPKENNWRVAENGTNKLSEVTDDVEPEPAPSDGVIVRYQPPNGECPVPEFITEVPKSDNMMELDFSSDELRDLFVDLDFLFGPVDEKMISLENENQFVLPDSPENDNMLEQLLLSHPLMDDGQIAEHDDEAQTDSRMEIGFTSELKESVKPNGSDNNASESTKIEITEAAAAYQSPVDNCEKLDILTKQLGHLNSEIGPKQ